MHDGSLDHTGDYFIVGGNNAGVFNQSGGSVTTNLNRRFFLSDGAGQTSSYNLNGGDLTVNFEGTYGNNDLHNFRIGRNGPDDLMLVNGGTLNVNNVNPASTDRRFYIHRNGTFQVTSGSATIDNFRFLLQKHIDLCFGSG